MSLDPIVAGSRQKFRLRRHFFFASQKQYADLMSARLNESPSGRQYTLRHGLHQATVVEVGAGLREYLHQGRPVVDGYASDEMCPMGTGQVLAPWPNRLGDGRYSFEGETLQLPLSEPGRHNAIHGLVRWLPWHAVAQTEDSVLLACHLPPQDGYPFDLDLSVRWSLGPEGLRADHEAVNRGSKACPFGLGVHPYVLPLEGCVDDQWLHLPAAQALETDARELPVQWHSVEGKAWDFRAPRSLKGVSLDKAFRHLGQDAQGLTHIQLGAPQGPGVELWMDAAFPFVQVFTGDVLPSPRTRRAVALEPMSCAPDAFRSQDGLVTLQPGQPWRGSWGLRPRSKAAGV